VRFWKNILPVDFIEKRVHRLNSFVRQSEHFHESEKRFCTLTIQYFSYIFLTQKRCEGYAKEQSDTHEHNLRWNR